jgi:predicted O-methyltransferase YrrM
LTLLGFRERQEIDRLWTRKLRQDAEGIQQRDRHRNLEPASAEFLCALAAGIEAGEMVEIGGSSGISTIALAVAARAVSGRLISIEIEPQRQQEARQTLARLELAPHVEFVLADAASILPTLGEVQLALIDCEKEDYIRFFDLLPLAAGGIVVADNIISHNLADYVAHVRSQPGVESITLPIGQGLEVTRLRPPESRT